MITRGVRNNNPFNIVINPNNNWTGKVSRGTDLKFEQFSKIIYGLRAGVKLIANYIKKGYDTPRKIIKRFAPYTENDTFAYLVYLGDKLSFDLDKRILPYSNDMYEVCSLICRYESLYDFHKLDYDLIVNFLNRKRK